jgi:uncharacterized protein
MTRTQKLFVLSLASGVIFGVGLCVSGMTRPEKVLGFLDVGGAWDPTLLCVMGGAVAVHFWAYRWARRQNAPRLAESFDVPAGSPIDARLALGAALFGVGWGVSGYCPGPALVSLPSGGWSVLVFVGTMLAGMWLASFLSSRGSASEADVSSAAPLRE